MKTINFNGRTVPHIEIRVSGGYKEELSWPDNRRQALTGEQAASLNEVEALQRAMFWRKTGAGIDNMLIQNTSQGVRLFNFTCSNFGYRDYDHGDYMIRSVTDITITPNCKP